MGFHILSGIDKTYVPGQIIQYKGSPFPGYYYPKFGGVKNFGENYNVK